MIHVARERHKAPAVISWMLRAVVAAVFLFAAWSKIENPTRFGQDIHAYRMVPVEAIPAMAAVLPWLELVCGVLLLTGFWVGEARTLTAAMLLMFNVANGWAMWKGLDIDCGCFGDAVKAGPKDVLTRNIALLLALGLDWALLYVARLRTALDEAVAEGRARASRM